jgi:hypothetical protein
MNFKLIAFTVGVIVLIMAGTTYARNDRGKDRPLISRMPGFWIAAYKDIQHDAYAFYDGDGSQINVEGHKYYIDYRLKKGASPPGRVMILKHHEKAFKKIGGKIFKGKKGHMYSKAVKDGKEIWIHLKSGVDRYYKLTIVEREQVEQKKTAEPDTPAKDTPTAPETIHEAAMQGDLEEVKAFLANGENIDLKDKGELPPLYYAALHDRRDICEFLISQGADVNAGREIGYVPLWGAMNSRSEGSVEIFKLLVNHGADYKINVGGYTMLHQAAYSCHDEYVRDIAEFLISKGMDVNARGHQDRTPLHTLRCREIGECLIEKGADLEARDQYGQTPIFEACSGTGRKEVCAFLISKGADVNAKDQRGWTPLRKVDDVCRRTGKTEICDLLKKHGGVK